jgi:hypothetical protein
MKMNIGRVSRGYHFMSFIAALNAISEPPFPQRNRAAMAATNPMAPNTLCPVRSMSIIDENISNAIIS